MQKLLVQVVIIALVVRCAVSQPCSLDPDGNAVEMVDVLILGAGISGIAAARTLEVNRTKTFLVIEATDRIGGRIRENDGTQLDNDKVRLEVGANWIQGLAEDINERERHPIWREWLRCNQAGPEGSATPDDFTHVYYIDDTEITTHRDYVDRRKDFKVAFEGAKEHKSSDISESLEDALKRWTKSKSSDISKSLEDALKGWKKNKSSDIWESLEDALKGWEARELCPVDGFIEWEGVDFCSATQPGKISQYHHSRLSYDTDFLADKKDDAINYLMADEKGYSYVVDDCLAKNFKNRIHMNSKITKIQTAEDCVCVTVEGNKLYCGDYSIVTFSIGVLQASINESKSSVFQFEPPLPQWKQDALNSITPVHYGKIHLQFGTPFWDEDQQILGNVGTERGYYPYFIFDKNRPHTVTADVTGDLAEKAADQNNKQETVSEVMAVLRKMFPKKNIAEPHMNNVIISSWSRDPLFLCTYSVIPPGVSKEIFKDLLEPVNGSLYFAGEALNGSNSGFTQGGYGSGVCVAKLLLGEKPVVGLEKTIYTVSEEDSEVEVCVVIKSECNVPFPFNVIISTKKGTANDSSSFQEISDSPKILMLDAHVKKNCTNISISISDDDDDDVFIISISLQSISGLYSGISLLSNEARVVVEDDTDGLTVGDYIVAILIYIGFSVATLVGCIIFLLCPICIFIYCLRKSYCKG